MFDVRGEYLPLGERPARKVWLGGLVATPHSSLCGKFGEDIRRDSINQCPLQLKRRVFLVTFGDFVLCGIEARRTTAVSTAEGDDFLGLVVV